MSAAAHPLILGGRVAGHLLVRAGEIEAIDSRGRSLGLFETLSEAAEILRQREIEP
jgi:hypothetical protein